ncbi:hypothetical protein JOB18_042712 [Solea senegalensis]|uniref:Uncharacterized protein n=1 Tax=Solea senegalensis TaxID=28829 RepID=A0AAV6S165_SOLSE|nr:hypothetical protein JOB18_042712 [Solea senegalensis]
MWLGYARCHASHRSRRTDTRLEHPHKDPLSGQDVFATRALKRYEKTYNKNTVPIRHTVVQLNRTKHEMIDILQMTAHHWGCDLQCHRRLTSEQQGVQESRNALTGKSITVISSV